MSARASAEYFNEVLVGAIRRMKVIADELVENVSRSGFPPFTLPVTLADLKKMTAEQAKDYLKSEIERTMQEDPVTGDKRPNPKVLELAVSYVEWMQNQQGQVKYG